MSTQIEFRRRRYKLEKHQSPSVVTTSHPLRGITLVDGGKVKRRLGGSTGSSKTSSRTQSPTRTQTAPLDPLSAAISASLTPTNSDPLSALASNMDSGAGGRTVNGGTESLQMNIENTEPWSARRSEILSRFTTSEKLSIVSSFLDPDAANPARHQSDQSVRERVQSRLEQLDDFEEGSVRETGNLTQQEYVTKISDLSRMLRKFWTSGERVRALKIAIQCAKLLNSITVVKFYPSKFVLVTDLLEDFGTLVFERLMDKAVHQTPGKRVSGLPQNFRPSQVPEAAKETTRNWFYKIASIRELLPRLYVEAALLKNYRYLDPLDISRALIRLSQQVRGIADPLVGAYLRAFIVRMGISATAGAGLTAKQLATLQTDREAVLTIAFKDTLAILKQIERPICMRLMAMQNIDLPTYLTLYTPALDWIIHCLVTCSSGDQNSVCDRVMAQCESTGPLQTLLIHSLMSTLPPAYVSQQAEKLSGLIVRACEDQTLGSGYPRHLLYHQFGASMVLSPPIDAAVRLTILQDVWKLVRQLTNPRDYIMCADTWVEFVAKFFGRKDMNALLGDIVQHVTPDRSFEELYGQLQSILGKLLSHIKSSADLYSLFGSEKFLQFVDLFQKDYTRVAACTAIFELFNRTSADEGMPEGLSIDDPVVVNTLLYLARMMHDSLDILNSSDGDKRIVSSLLKGFIARVDFTSTMNAGEAVERQLAFYVDCRAAFPNLEPVQAHLTLCVNSLAMNCLQRVKGNHTAKSGAFVRACIAFSFITIPSLTEVAMRIKLYANTSSVALSNACFGQADACFKSAIGLLRELPRASVSSMTVPASSQGPGFETLLVELTGLLASSLLMAPDNPAQGCLYLLKGLLNAVQEAAGMNVVLRTQAFLNVVPLLAALKQPDYLYHACGKIDANDIMYGSDPLFLAELDKIGQTVLFEVNAGLPGCTLTTNYRYLLLLVSTVRLANPNNRETLTGIMRACEERASREGSGGEVGRLKRAVIRRLKNEATRGQDEETEGAAELLNLMGVK